jgi:hypothetical protein
MKGRREEKRENRAKNINKNRNSSADAARQTRTCKMRTSVQNRKTNRDVV